MHWEIPSIISRIQLTVYCNRFSPKNSLGTVTLSPSETLKLALTLRNSAGPARPHQAFLLVSSGDAEHPDLETFFPLAVKGMSGKARVEVVRPLYLIASGQSDS